MAVVENGCTTPDQIFDCLVGDHAMHGYAFSATFQHAVQWRYKRCAGD